jgi:hypothetical protein
VAPRAAHDTKPRRCKTCGRALRSVHHQSDRENWCSPPEAVEPARKALGGKIWLDPCSNSKSIVGAVHSIVLPLDGLTLAWDAFGDTAYVNPPYGRKLPAWISRCIEHMAFMRIVGLITARPDTKWRQDLVMPTVTALCDLRGRLHFIGAKDPAPFPSSFPYWSPDRDADPFIAAFAGMGTIMARTPITDRMTVIS